MKRNEYTMPTAPIYDDVKVLKNFRALLRYGFNELLARPDHWDQTDWGNWEVANDPQDRLGRFNPSIGQYPCGSAFCLAGFMAYRSQINEPMYTDAGTADTFDPNVLIGRSITGFDIPLSQWLRQYGSEEILVAWEGLTGAENDFDMLCRSFERLLRMLDMQIEFEEIFVKLLGILPLTEARQRLTERGFDLPENLTRVAA